MLCDSNGTKKEALSPVRIHRRPKRLQRALHFFFLETALHCISASRDANSNPFKGRFTEMRTEQG